MAENANSVWQIHAISETGLSITRKGWYTCRWAASMNQIVIRAFGLAPPAWLAHRVAVGYAGPWPGHYVSHYSHGIISILCLRRPPGHKKDFGAPFALVRA